MEWELHRVPRRRSLCCSRVPIGFAPVVMLLLDLGVCLLVDAIVNHVFADHLACVGTRSKQVIEGLDRIERSAQKIPKVFRRTSELDIARIHGEGVWEHRKL